MFTMCIKKVHKAFIFTISYTILFNFGGFSAKSFNSLRIRQLVTITTAGSRLFKWPIAEDLVPDYKSGVGRLARDVSLKAQLKVVRAAISIILASGILVKWGRETESEFSL